MKRALNVLGLALGGLWLIGGSEVSAAEPVVLGKGQTRFEVGAMLEADDFADLDQWTVQIEERDGFPEGKVEAVDENLVCVLPGRGCTIWFNKKLPGRIAITYEVVCPKVEPRVKGMEPRDVNQFWMATDPVTPEEGLFDSNRYTGRFGSYGKMHGYYASTGGGKNTTTRMRRYPREKDGKPVEHVALTDKDGKAEFMITPGKKMRVQLVAFDDLVQYIVDGRIVYEMAHGDRVETERIDENGRRVTREVANSAERFPAYQEGYFGFRMVGTRHVYSRFRVHRLEPVGERRSPLRPPPLKTESPT